MSRKKDWLYMGLGLLGFYGLFWVMAFLMQQVFPGAHFVVLVLAVTAPSFFAGAKLYALGAGSKR